MIIDYCSVYKFLCINTNILIFKNINRKYIFYDIQMVNALCHLLKY